MSDLVDRARFVVQLFRECDAIQLPHGPTEEVLTGMIERIEVLEADLAAEKARADARVTAALQAAADAVKVPRFCDEKNLPKVTALHEARKAILALIPDAGAALDRAIAEAVQAEREACARVVFDLLCDAGEPGTAAIVGDAIRARTEGEG